MYVIKCKEEIKKNRRNDIIEGSKKVFFEKGYSIATMDDVSKTAGCSKRTIYKYFNSKEQIYFEIMIKGYRLFLEILEAELKNITENNNMLDKIRQIGKSLYKFSHEYNNYFNAIMEYENGELDFQNNISDKSREECYALGEKVLSYLIDALKKGIEEGSVRSEIEVNSTALILWSSTIGLLKVIKKKSMYIMNYYNKDSEELVVEAFELLIESIKK